MILKPLLMTTLPFASLKKDAPVPDAIPRPSVRLHESIRIGSVPYLNAKPLTHALDPAITLLEPARLAAELRAGNLDIALVPLMEVLEAPADSYRVADDIAIGADRAVYSVYLNYAVPLARIKTVALDPASKTSVELARLILEKFHRLKPRYVSPGEPADAQLLIGDPAIAYRQAHPEQKYLDLAQAWREYTQLPFVFAVWAIRLPFWRAFWSARQLRAAKRLGLAARPQIARNAFERQYLAHHLAYNLGSPQKRAISLFSEMLVQSGRLPVTHALRYL
jgi:chorismate dehydratase